MKRLIDLGFIAFACLTTMKLSAMPIAFDDMGDASAYIFNDFTGTNSDSQKALWVGGNADFSSYSVATLNDWNSLALTVQGNFSQSGGDVNGLSSIGGDILITSASALRTTTESRNFDQQYFTELSQRLSAQENGTHAIVWGALQLSLSRNLINDTLFVSLDQQILDSVWGIFTQDIFNGTRVVLNVSGTDVSMSGSKDWWLKDHNYSFNHKANNVLFNFYEAENLSIAGGIYASILAPNADVIGGSGALNGQLIANSFNGSTQLNDAAFSVDTPATDVSEPAAFYLVAFVVFLLGVRRLQKFRWVKQDEGCPA
ncbi:choice-of-anchor A family protein [Alteromonas facilis]|uniref:choice-of-anchor A family protein n=1 Tax=Alteromonas facilis TaxID=2048004 RepID=UPI000C2847FB|nr:choice-of-anchor A family protein [Alteromonas facilis]